MWLDDVRPRAGRTVPLKVLTRSYRGDEKISTDPDRDSGERVRQLSVMVTDGRQLNQLEQRELRRTLQPQSVRADDPRAQRDAPQQPHLRPAPHRHAGAVVNGEALPSLPPSVLAVLEGDRSGGSFTPIRSAALGEWELAMDSAVTGTRVLTIDLDDHPGR